MIIMKDKEGKEVIEITDTTIKSLDPLYHKKCDRLKHYGVSIGDQFTEGGVKVDVYDHAFMGTPGFAKMAALQLEQEKGLKAVTKDDIPV